MAQIHIVPHTHWDREWYLPFQSFRLKLVHLIDSLLDTLLEDPDFKFFTLDGQTIILEDYLAVRPERAGDMRSLIQSGRLLIGPWYILPDEFLVSPEALIRNLLHGARYCEGYGATMPVGYLPDPFGHIGQLPQILVGFDLPFAIFKRGLGDEPLELSWQSPDGSSVLVSYLRDGYDNAARLPVDRDTFAQIIEERVASLLPYSVCEHLLLMNGTDHHEAQRELPGLIAGYANGSDSLILSNLLAYFQSIQAVADDPDISFPIIRGELRDPSRHHLLPGVLSSRTWIKQRNHACETLLERWAEPFSAWANLLPSGKDRAYVWTGHLATPFIGKSDGILREAWRLLLTCQPHDSICGCSIDQVHREMSARFDQAEQIGEEITRQSLVHIANQIDTSLFDPVETNGYLVVFNPHPQKRSDLATVEMELPAGIDQFMIVDEHGKSIPYRILDLRERSLADLELDQPSMLAMLALVSEGEVMGLSIQDAAIYEQEGKTRIDVIVAEEAPSRFMALKEQFELLEAKVVKEPEALYHLRARFATKAKVELFAPDVPGLGYKLFILRRGRPEHVEGTNVAKLEMENQFLQVSLDPQGELCITDKHNDRSYPNVLRFADIGERGDSYTHCGVQSKDPVTSPFRVELGSMENSALGATLNYTLIFAIPEGLDKERDIRSPRTIELPVEVTVKLVMDSPRLDIEIEVDNQARDHRLQVIVPTGIPGRHGLFDGHFAWELRSTEPPEAKDEWIEQPVHEKPMRCFVGVNNPQVGFLVASQGLREASVSRDGTIAITLLRCFGWLSRDDLDTRRGGAGPQLETPEGQSLGTHQFALSLIPFGVDIQKAVAEAYAFQSRLRGVQTASHDGMFPLEASLFRLSPNTIQLSTLKRSEDGNYLIFRGYNPTSDSTVVRLDSLLEIENAWRAGLNEAPQSQIDIPEPTHFLFTVDPYQVFTLLIQPTAQ